MRNKYDDGTPIEWIPVSERFPSDGRVLYVKGVYGKKRREYVTLACWCGDLKIYKDAPNKNVWESAERGEGGSFCVGVTHWAESMSPGQRERAEARLRAHRKAAQGILP